MSVVDLKPPAGDPELRVLAANIKRLRDERDLTRKELARRVGATDRQVEHWENAESVPRPRHLVNLARMFRTTIERLLIDPADLEQHVRHITTQIDVLTNMTGATVILNLSNLEVRAVPDPDAPGQHSVVEIKGSVISQGHRELNADVSKEEVEILPADDAEPDTAIVSS